MMRHTEMDGETLTLEGVLAELGREAVSRGASGPSAGHAAQVTRGKLGPELGRGPLSARAAARVRAYHAAVLRREVCRRGHAADAGYRRMLRVASAMQDLRAAGFDDGRVREELVATLRMDEAIVDECLRGVGGAAVA